MVGGLLDAMMESNNAAEIMTALDDGDDSTASAEWFRKIFRRGRSLFRKGRRLIRTGRRRLMRTGHRLIRTGRRFFRNHGGRIIRRLIRYGKCNRVFQG